MDPREALGLTGRTRFTRKESNAVATDVGADFINIDVFCSDKSLVLEPSHSKAFWKPEGFVVFKAAHHTSRPLVASRTSKFTGFLLQASEWAARKVIKTYFVYLNTRVTQATVRYDNL